MWLFDMELRFEVEIFVGLVMESRAMGLLLVDERETTDVPE